MHPAVSHLHAGYCAAAIVVALHSFTDFSLHLPANFAFLSVVLGIGLGLEPRMIGPRFNDS